MRDTPLEIISHPEQMFSMSQPPFSEKMDKRGREYVRERMPLIGLGTYQVRSKATIYSILDAALEAGYRFIDTAQCYGNEGYIGEALRELLPKQGLKREDVFITTKVSPANQGAKKAGASVEKSLLSLRLEYLDCVIIHWPGTSKLDPKSPQNAVYRRDTWTVLEQLYREGKVRSIGVSNYEIRHLEELFSHATVLPCLNQVEYHPFFHQDDLVAFCKQQDIHFQAYSSLGGPELVQELLADKSVAELSERYSLPKAVVLLRWATSQGISVLPRSCHPDRVKDNFQATLANFSQEEVETLRFKKTEKACWDPNIVA